MVNATQDSLRANGRPARTLRHSVTVTSALVLAAGLAATGGASAFADGHMSSGRAQTLLNVNRSFTTSPKPAPTPTPSNLLVGARAADVSFSAMDATIGPVRVTRTFYTGTLPATFSRGTVTAGVKIIVSYKTPSANTASYVKSIPAGADVELCFHHEPEGDYAHGADFVKAFDIEADVVHKANPAMHFDYIALGYAYQGGPTSSAGMDGSYVPDKSDFNYVDSYQRSAIQPAQTDPKVQNFIKALHAKGKKFNGFTEYGRGVVAPGASFNQSIATARAKIIAVDATYIKTLPDVNVWAYWYTTGSAGQWRFTDSASIDAWKTVENANK